MLELLCAAMQIADLDSEVAVKESTCAMAITPETRLTRLRLRDEDSCDNLWNYFNRAAEDAFSVSEVKPSELRRQRKNDAREEERAVTEGLE